MNSDIEYLTFTAEEDGTTFSFTKHGTGNIDYSIDNGFTWTSLESGANTPPINTGEKMMWRGEMIRSTSGNLGIGRFSSTGRFRVGGNPYSLVNKVNSADPNNGKYCLYANLFNGCSLLTDASQLNINHEVAQGYMCASMFKLCTSLVVGPSLQKIKVVAQFTFSEMFFGCTSLVVAPDLPNAVFLTENGASNHCKHMFRECYLLKKAPAMPTMGLASYCYNEMYRGCDSLEEIVLPAEVLVQGCYVGMFLSLDYRLSIDGRTHKCTNLKYIKMMSINAAPSSDYCANWVTDVPSGGTFVKNSAAEWKDNPFGKSAIPTEWTVIESNEEQQ